MKKPIRIFVLFLATTFVSCSTTIKQDKLDCENHNFVVGRATNFGYQDYKKVLVRKGKKKWYEIRRLDNGKGSFLLDPDYKRQGIDTNKSYVRGVALPKDILEDALNIPCLTSYEIRKNPRKAWEIWAPARKAAVRLRYGNIEKKERIVDLGPGSGPRSNGVVIDLAEGTKREFGFYDKNINVYGFSYQLIPDYFKNTD
jgi:hypothetical protein